MMWSSRSLNLFFGKSPFKMAFNFKAFINIYDKS